MNTQRLFNLIIAIVLLVALLLTVQEVAATADLVGPANPGNALDAECTSLPSRHSIRSEYVSEMGAWMTYTDEGPTGTDGGLVHILSNCSQ